MVFDELYRRRLAQREAEVAEAERLAVAAGRERFDLARLEELLGAAPGSYAEREDRLRRSYYFVHTGVRTLADFAELLQELWRWD